MALSAVAKAGLASGIGSRTNAAKRVAEMLKQCFAIPPDQFKVCRAGLQQLFRRGTKRCMQTRASMNHSHTRRSVQAYPALLTYSGLRTPAQGAVEGALACALAFSKVPRTSEAELPAGR